MTPRFPALLLVCAGLSAPLLATCGGDDSDSTSTPPATVVIAVSESRTEQAMGSIEPYGVFMVVRYVLANGSDEDIVVSQDDFTLVAADGTALDRSGRGTVAWGKSPGGYELTETVLLKPGGMPRSWVSVFDVPREYEGGAWSLRYKGEPPVNVPPHPAE